MKSDPFSLVIFVIVAVTIFVIVIEILIRRADRKAQERKLGSPKVDEHDLS